MIETTQQEDFFRPHWLCVGQVTEAARDLVRKGGGKCLDLLNPDTPTFVVVMLPANVPDWGIFFRDEGYNLNFTLGNSEDDPTVTLYSRNISPVLIQESMTDLVLSTPDEWKKYQARRIAESHEKYSR